MNAPASNIVSDAVRMAFKQRYFVNTHVARLPLCHSIAFLDLPISTDPIDEHADWTLRRFLMKSSPSGFPSQRLFSTADEAWDGNGITLYTFSPYYDEAALALNNMIPECLATFGNPAAKWFTSEGIASSKDVIWNPDQRKSLSSNTEIHDCVDKDYCGMGDKWIPENEPMLDDVIIIPAILNPSVPATTANDVINQRLTPGIRTDQSVASFGDRVFARDHDGDTVKTVVPTSTKTPPSLLTPRVQIDLTGMDIDRADHLDRDDDSISMSTMAKTTKSTRQNLKTTKKHNSALMQENELQSRLREESEQLAETLQNRLDQAMAQLAALQSSSNKPRKQVTMQSPAPSASGGGKSASPALRGAGHNS